jgi:hypothetical protein
MLGFQLEWPDNWLTLVPAIVEIDGDNAPVLTRLETMSCPSDLSTIGFFPSSSSFDRLKKTGQTICFNSPKMGLYGNEMTTKSRSF